MHYDILFGAHDMQFHIKRIMELKDSINNGQLLPVTSFNFFHGSVVMGMYPYFVLYPFIILLYITKSFITSYYCFFLIIILSSLMISFFSSLSFSKSYMISYIFSIVYSLSSTFILEMFLVGDLGIVTSFIFMPLVIFGFIEWLKSHKTSGKLILGLTLMSFCQLSNITITLAFLFVWGIYNFSRINEESIKSIIIMFVNVLLLTSVIWIPIMYIHFSGNEINGVIPVQLNGFNSKAFLANISFSSIIVIFLVPFCWHKFNGVEKQMYLLSIFIILISSKLMPWTYITKGPLSFLNQFQFTLRFLVMPQILLCYLFSSLFIRFIHKFGIRKILIFLFILFIIAYQLLCQGYIVNKSRNYKTLKNYKQTEVTHLGYCTIDNNKDIKYLINGYFNNHDYYPVMTNHEYKNVNNSIGLYNSHNSFKLRHKRFNTFTFYLPKRSKRVTLPVLSYKGEHLRLFLNHHLTKYKTHNKLIVINANKGLNILHIEYVYKLWVLFIKIVLFISGLFMALFLRVKRKE